MSATFSGARAAAPMAREGATGRRFVVRLVLDPDKVRRRRADTDAAVRSLTAATGTPAPPLAPKAVEQIAGTITVTLDVDATGQVSRRNKVTTELVTTVAGQTERTVVSDTTEHIPAHDQPR